MATPTPVLDDIVLQASETFSRLAERFQRDHPNLLRRYPVAAYIEALDRMPALQGYGRLSPVLEKRCREIEADGGPGTLDAYHRLVLACLIADADKRMTGLRIPASMTALLAAAFGQILARLENSQGGFWLPDNELFRKDLALCRLKLLPCGSELVDVCSGIPRSILFRGGALQLARGLGFFLASGAGFRPWYESHWDRRLARAFTPQGYEQCYLRVAELLRLNPEVRGLSGASWWFDPALGEISPELGFLTRLPLDNGARLFRVGSSESATRDALRFSAPRRELYAAGRYTPAVYLLAWARRDLLRWANRRVGTRLSAQQ